MADKNQLMKGPDPEPYAPSAPLSDPATQAVALALADGASAPIQPGGAMPYNVQMLPMGRGPTPGVTCPIIKAGERPFQIQRMDVNIEVHVSVAFVSITALFVNTGAPSESVFHLPMNQYGVVTHCSMNLGGKRLLETTVVDPKAIEGVKRREGGQDFGGYNPHLFRLPVPSVTQNEPITLQLTYFEPLEYRAGHFRLFVPLVVPREAWFRSPDVTCTINTGTPNTQWGSTSHPMLVRGQAESSRIECYADTRTPINKDFDISYLAQSPHIVGTCLFQESGPEYDPRGSFLMFLAPPQQTESFFRRDVVFLLDHSGSMHGKPLESAKRAVIYSLQQLRGEDFFAICAFDHREDWYQGGQMQAATPGAIEQAMAWVQSIDCSGGTDILSPLMRAVELVQPATTSGGIPFVFLMTDGAVSNEREICHTIHELKTPARICTFGIGTYCNEFFLKMLAMTGRGFSDVAYYPDQLFDQITRFFELAQTPAMTNIEIGLPAVDGVEMYPFPIPDLFLGAPLVVSGKFTGPFTSSVPVRGTVILRGAPQFVEMQIAASSTRVIPLHKVFAKQRLDLLTAKAWLEDSDKLRDQVTQISIAENMPSAHAPMIAYETTPEKKERRDHDGAKGVSKASLAAAAVGGVFVVGAVSMAFGDIGATLANSKTIDRLADYVLEDLGLGDDLEDVGRDIADGAEGCCDCIGDCCGDCCGCIGDCCGCIGDCCGDVCSACGDAASCLCDCLGDVCGVIGDMLSCFFECLCCCCDDDD